MCFLEYCWEDDFAEAIDIPGFVSLSTSPLPYKDRKQTIRPSWFIRQLHE